MKRYALGLDFGTESVRALVVECATGAEAAQSTVRYPHGVITDRLPGSEKALPPDFALQHPQDYLDAAIAALSEVAKKVPAAEIIGIGVDFTACTILPVLEDGTPLMSLERFAGNPHAWVKLWKHHAAQPEADRINALARERGERFLRYYSGIISSEWMLPKCWEIASKAPEVFAAADLIVDAGDWFVQQMTGSFCRNSCAAGYKGLWNAELGFPSAEFLKALDPALAGLRDKWLKNITPPGRRAGTLTRAFAARTGLREGTPVSAATIDAHSGVAGMGVSKEGPMSIIMGTSSCHMSLSRDLKLFDGYAGVVKDGILPGFYGYESGQSAVGDIFGWFVNDFLKVPDSDPFAEIAKRAAALEPGSGGVVALDWMNGNRSVLMNANLSGMLLGLTLRTKPEEVYRALIEGTAFGTRMIIEASKRGGVTVDELVVCGGLTKDPMIMQIYADVTGLEVKVSPSTQAVALGAAIFGASAAGAKNGGFDTMPEAIAAMTKPAERTYKPGKKAGAVYEQLYAAYQRTHDFFGRENAALMKSLRETVTTTREK
ncbi:MAG: ribulokinase [Elusimicrobia bacterium]|nr:ribulokinase [Elusimicrobiota bacterium]